MECPLVVSVRCRRMTTRELELGAARVPHRASTNFGCVEIKDKTTLVVCDPDSTCTVVRRDRVYTFDRVFDATVSNETVFQEVVSPLIPSVVQGYNATCFAYGMTGAGKTYTMVGDDASGVRGLCALCVDSLFCEEARARRDTGAIMTIHASYLEIYNEKIKDLLVSPSGRLSTGGTPLKTSSSSSAKSSNSNSLEIVEDATKGVVVVGLTEVLVTTLKDLQNVLLVGNERRTMASTVSNVASSRSHAVLQLVVRVSTALQSNMGRLMLIDLAGSERATHYSSHEKAKTQLRTLEGANINKSLLALGNCIMLLGSSSGTLNHIPYRDSKLTRLLKDSLGGNTKTVMIATVSPSCLCYEETLSTLKYATRAKLITKRVYKNRSDSQSSTEDYEAMKQTLRNEIVTLKTQISMAHKALNNDFRTTNNGRLSDLFRCEDTNTMEKHRLQREHFSTLIALKEQLLSAESTYERQQPQISSSLIDSEPLIITKSYHADLNTTSAQPSRSTVLGGGTEHHAITPPSSWREANAIKVISGIESPPPPLLITSSSSYCSNTPKQLLTSQTPLVTNQSSPRTPQPALRPSNLTNMILAMSKDTVMKGKSVNHVDPHKLQLPPQQQQSLSHHTVASNPPTRTNSSSSSSCMTPRRSAFAMSLALKENENAVNPGMSPLHMKIEAAMESRRNALAQIDKLLSKNTKGTPMANISMNQSSKKDLYV